MPKKRSAPSAIIKPPKRTRFKLGRSSGQVALERLIANPELGGEPPRVLLVVRMPPSSM